MTDTAPAPALVDVEVALDAAIRDLETVRPADEASLWQLADLVTRLRAIWGQVYELKCRQEVSP